MQVNDKLYHIMPYKGQQTTIPKKTVVYYDICISRSEIHI